MLHYKFSYFKTLQKMNILYIILKLVVCILLRVLGQVQGFRLTQHWFEYFIQTPNLTYYIYIKPISYYTVTLNACLFKYYDSVYILISITDLTNTMLQAGRSWAWFPILSLDSSIGLILPFAIALGSTQLLKEMTTRNIPGGKLLQPHCHLWADCPENVGNFTACYRHSFSLTFAPNHSAFV
jgi:hypothetical protein